MYGIANAMRIRPMTTIAMKRNAQMFARELSDIVGLLSGAQIVYGVRMPVHYLPPRGMAEERLLSNRTAVPCPRGLSSLYSHLTV